MYSVLINLCSATNVNQWDQKAELDAAIYDKEYHFCSLFNRILTLNAEEFNGREERKNRLLQELRGIYSVSESNILIHIVGHGVVQNDEGVGIECIRYEELHCALCNIGAVKSLIVNLLSPCMTNAISRFNNHNFIVLYNNCPERDINSPFEIDKLIVENDGITEEQFHRFCHQRNHTDDYYIRMQSE